MLTCRWCGCPLEMDGAGHWMNCSVGTVRYTCDQSPLRARWHAPDLPVDLTRANVEVWLDA